MDEFDLFKARALGGGIAPLTREVQSLPSTPPGTPDRIREEDDEYEDLDSPSGSIGSGHLHHHHHHRHRGRREAGPGAVPTQLSQDSTEGSLHDVSVKESRHVLRMPSFTVDPPSPCEERLPALDAMNTSLPKLDSGLQRSHSCRVRRSPRQETTSRRPAADDQPHHSSHQRLLDRQDHDQPAFNRNRNRTMPVKRNRSPRRFSQTLQEPFGHDFISPSDLEDGECRIYRVRSFTTHGSGVVNRGDSFKIKSRSPRGGSLRHKTSPSRCSMLNQSTELDQHEDCNGTIGIPAIAIDTVSLYDVEGAIGGCERNGINGDEEVETLPPVNGGNRVEEDRGEDEEEEEEEEEAYINRVLVLGSQGVGKTTLTQQLMTSEYLANKEGGTADEETGDPIVSVMLDDIESMVLFLDTRGAEPVKDRDDVDAFLVVYSITDRNSYSYAQACLQDICSKGKGSKKAVILVANKQESVRNRAVTEDDGRNMATKKRCKFIEVSALLDHKVDELLVGIIRQLRIKRALAQQSSGGDAKSSPSGCLHKAAFGLFRKIFRRSEPGVARSCDNLLV